MTQQTDAAEAVALLKERGMTVAVAESLTGGMVASRIVDIPGASAVFGTGVVSYQNACKMKLLGVSEDTLRELGAVSRETALQMASGVRRLAGATVGISTTGEAGPDAAEKPVGTVFVALTDGERAIVRKLLLSSPGCDRAEIRRRAADAALTLLCDYLHGEKESEAV